MQIRQVALARSTFPVGQTLMALHYESVAPAEFGVHIHQFTLLPIFTRQIGDGRNGHGGRGSHGGVRDVEYFDRDPVAALKKSAQEAVRRMLAVTGPSAFDQGRRFRDSGREQVGATAERLYAPVEAGDFLGPTVRTCAVIGLVDCGQVATLYRLGFCT